jgi:hypothetical protein
MRRALMVLFAAGVVGGAAACGDDGGDSETGPTTTTRPDRGPLVATSIGPATSSAASTEPSTAARPPLPTAAPAEVPEECDVFPAWLGASSSAVVRRTEGSATCDEISAVAREFFYAPGVPPTATVQGWECTRDAVGVDHVGDCVGPNGRLTVDVTRPGDA